MSKYKSVKEVVNGIEFDSRKEARRYTQLLQMQKDGEISNLQLQVKYELIPSQFKEVVEVTPKKKLAKKSMKLAERKVEYVADFVYEKDGKTIVEDVKGYRRGGAYSVFVLKRKMMLYFFGIEVKEV